METYKVEVHNTITVTAEDIDDIMCCALEGGITYWCGKAKVTGAYLGDYASEQIARGGTLLLFDAEDDEIYELNIDKLLNGIKIAYENQFFSEYEWCNGKELDCCNVDAMVADCIVQCALFGDVIYG